MQPDLQDRFGIRFYGVAKTVTGDIWWYESDGKRYPLFPAKVLATAQQ